MDGSPIPMPVLRLLRHPDSSKILSTVGDDGYPHSIVVGAFLVDEQGLIYVGEAFMYRSSEYLEKNPKAEVLVWMGKDGYSIRVEAVDHITEGPKIDEINVMLDRKGMTAVALWVFKPIQTWDESASYTSGNKLWTRSARGRPAGPSSTWRRRSPAWASASP